VDNKARVVVVSSLLATTSSTSTSRNLEYPKSPFAVANNHLPYWTIKGSLNPTSPRTLSIASCVAPPPELRAVTKSPGIAEGKTKKARLPVNKTVGMTSSMRFKI
jgi:hypothetical protein